MRHPEFLLCDYEPFVCARVPLAPQPSFMYPLVEETSYDCELDLSAFFFISLTVLSFDAFSMQHSSLFFPTKHFEIVSGAKSSSLSIKFNGKEIIYDAKIHSKLNQNHGGTPIPLKPSPTSVAEKRCPIE